MVSDTEEESHGRLSLNRKAEMLNIHDANEEFEMKSLCLKRKSVDFEMDRSKQVAKLQFRVGPNGSGFHQNPQSIYNNLDGAAGAKDMVLM